MEADTFSVAATPWRRESNAVVVELALPSELLVTLTVTPQTLRLKLSWELYAAPAGSGGREAVIDAV